MNFIQKYFYFNNLFPNFFFHIFYLTLRFPSTAWSWGTFPLAPEEATSLDAVLFFYNYIKLFFYVIVRESVE